MWVHLRKEQFPSLHNSMLKPRGDGTFQVLELINDNAYKLELSPSFGVHDVFNVADLALFLVDDEDDLLSLDSMSNPFEQREDDVTLSHQDQAKTDVVSSSATSGAPGSADASNSPWALSFGDHHC